MVVAVQKTIREAEAFRLVGEGGGLDFANHLRFHQILNIKKLKRP